MDGIRVVISAYVDGRMVATSTAQKIVSVRAGHADTMTVMSAVDACIREAIQLNREHEASGR